MVMIDLGESLPLDCEYHNDVCYGITCSFDFIFDMDMLSIIHYGSWCNCIKDDIEDYRNRRSLSADD